ncbi:MAG: fused response regulator/phosphatase [Pseudomonadota bacterium]|nr:fused response regulator/phosphatase [Pseudomonadota bacterium]
MKILIVDDETINRALLANMLHNAGYTDCVVAESGEEALRLFEQETPDLVLLDVVMPGMSGFDVAPLIRSKADGSYLPILFITALEDKESLVRCLEVGGNDFATKPFDRHILVAKIRAHLKIRALSLHIEQQNQTLRMYQQRVAREHAIVEHIFSHAIINNPEVISHFDCHLQPAETFNGDLFLCEASPSGGIYFLVADFTGHGLASAIGALPVTRAFHEYSQKGVSIAETVSELNKILLQILPGDMFMAAVVGEINAAGDKVSLWHGGMPAAIVPSNSKFAFRTFPSRHMALGILEEHELNTDYDIVQLGVGEQLIIYSDGLIESPNENDEMLMEEGLIELIRDETKTNGKVLAKSLYKRVQQHAAAPVFDDDVTLVVFTSKPINISSNAGDVGLPSVHEVVLKPEHLKQPDILQRVLQLASSGEGVQRVRSILYTVLSELFNNALEHGILCLDSKLKSGVDGFQTYYENREVALEALEEGTITIRIESQPTANHIIISVEDSGEGFKWEGSQQFNHDEFHGRGLALLHTLCEKLWFENNGSKVNCILDTTNSNLL